MLLMKNLVSKGLLCLKAPELGTLKGIVSGINLNLGKGLGLNLVPGKPLVKVVDLGPNLRG